MAIYQQLMDVNKQQTKVPTPKLSRGHGHLIQASPFKLPCSVLLPQNIVIRKEPPKCGDERETVGKTEEYIQKPILFLVVTELFYTAASGQSDLRSA